MYARPVTHLHDFLSKYELKNSAEIIFATSSEVIQGKSVRISDCIVCQHKLAN